MNIRAQHYFRNKHCLVLGLAKSGFAVAKLLSRLGAKVTVNERKERSACTGVEELEAFGVKVICGEHPLTLLKEDLFLIIKNPGIPYDIPFLVEAETLGIPVVTEVEIGYLITEAPIIGITGSNGKTTTTTLVYEMLKESAHTPLIAGNIGTVFCEVAEKARSDQWIVAELSSFQLLSTEHFSPQIGLLLNLFEAHLDYHHTKEHYQQAKANLFANQTNDQLAIFNFDQEETRAIAKQVNAKIAWFSLTSEVDNGSFLRGEDIVYRSENGEETIVININDLKLPGTHNVENVLAAITVCMNAGALIERIRYVLRTFSGVAHRLQFIRELRGVRYYNDSKATNSIATQKSLQAFEDDIILIAGGLDRGESLHSLEPLFEERVKAIVTYGQVAQKLMDVAKKAGVNEIIRVDNVKEAVNAAYDISTAGDIVLLSPAAASWDQFESFEERGDMFTKCVHMLR